MTLYGQSVIIIIEVPRSVPVLQGMEVIAMLIPAFIIDELLSHTKEHSPQIPTFDKMEIPLPSYDSSDDINSDKEQPSEQGVAIIDFSLD